MGVILTEVRIFDVRVEVSDAVLCVCERVDERLPLDLCLVCMVAMWMFEVEVGHCLV